MSKGNRLTAFILVAMVLGIGVGYIVHQNSSVEFIKKFSDNIKLLTTVFLRLVQMIIAPLVFCTLVVGIAKLGDLKTVGRIGGKALLWFISASLASLLLGMLLVNLFKPGAAIDLRMQIQQAQKILLVKRRNFLLPALWNTFFRKASLRPWRIMKYCRSWSSVYFLALPRQHCMIMQNR